MLYIHNALWFFRSFKTYSCSQMHSKCQWKSINLRLVFIVNGLLGSFLYKLNGEVHRTEKREKMVGSAVAYPPNLKKYGVPSYSVAWIPPNVIKPVLNQTTGEASDIFESSTPQPSEQSGVHYIAITGGGDEGSSGIPNAVLLAHHDVPSNSHSDQPGENFSSCRFSQINDRTYVLYMADKGRSILTWDAKIGTRIGSKCIIRDAISGFNVSTDGKLVACGTPSGDIVIVNSINLQILSMIKKAYLGVLTALAFSHHSRVLASVSFDSSAKVIVIEENQKSGGLSLWIVVLIIILAIVAAYFLKLQDIDKLRLSFLQN